MAIDFKGSLDSILNAYTKVSEVRAGADVARFNAAGMQQQSLLHNPQGLNQREAYATGNAANQALRENSARGGGVPPAVIYGGLAVLGVGLLVVALK